MCVPSFIIWQYSEDGCMHLMKYNAQIKPAYFTSGVNTLS